jgi:hypothetical protein
MKSMRIFSRALTQNKNPRYYHSYPDPSEAPVISQYLIPGSTESRQKMKTRSPEMIQNIANLKHRLSFEKSSDDAEQERKNFSSKATQKRNEFLPQITKLENGLTVVSVEADDMTMSSFTFLLKSGRLNTILSFPLF